MDRVQLQKIKSTLVSGSRTGFDQGNYVLIKMLEGQEKQDQIRTVPKPTRPLLPSGNCRNLLSQGDAFYSRKSEQMTPESCNLHHPLSKQNGAPHLAFLSV